MDRASMTEVGERAYRALKLENGNRDARALLLTEHVQARIDSALAHEREHARMDELEGAIPAGMGVSCSRCSLRYDVPAEEPWDETLGPCGCVDYHQADCDLGGAHSYSGYYAEEYAGDGYDEFEC